MVVLKIALLGDGAVGKTSLRRRYMGEGFDKNYQLTVGADFSMKDVVIDGRKVRFQIWDLAGQQRFEVVRTAYYGGAIGGILVYDISRPETFFNSPKWIKELWKHNEVGVVPVVVLGNKADLRGLLPTEITYEQGVAFANQLTRLTQKAGFTVDYFDTSAKTGLNVNEAFENLGKKIIEFSARKRAVAERMEERPRI